MKAYIIEKATSRCLEVLNVVDFNINRFAEKYKRPMPIIQTEFDIKAKIPVAHSRKERKAWRDFVNQSPKPHLATKQELRNILVERGFPIEKLEIMTRKQLCRAVMIPANSHLH